MTNEEARRILIQNTESLKANPLVTVDDCLYEALDMAIKALEQQQRDCKTCKHSNNGNCAGTEECHECMWESKYEQQPCEDCFTDDEKRIFLASVAREMRVCEQIDSEKTKVKLVPILERVKDKVLRSSLWEEKE